DMGLLTREVAIISLACHVRGPLAPVLDVPVRSPSASFRCGGEGAEEAGHDIEIMDKTLFNSAELVSFDNLVGERNVLSLSVGVDPNAPRNESSANHVLGHEPAYPGGSCTALNVEARVLDHILALSLRELAKHAHRRVPQRNEQIDEFTVLRIEEGAELASSDCEAAHRLEIVSPGNLDEGLCVAKGFSKGLPSDYIGTKDDAIDLA